MKFTTRLVLCTVIPSSLFVLALGLALWSLVRTQHDFNRYIGVEQAVVTGLSEMYAQGLQSGQALRNILLDPANRTAYTNFDAAQSAFAQAHTATLASARGTAFEADVQALLALRNHQFAAQQQVQALAQSDASQAVALLNTQETPAWRALRSALLQQLETARTAAATANAATQAQAQRMQLLAAALALVAAVAALALTGVMLRTLRRELGGDLAQARSALHRVAEGDLTLGAADQGGPAALGLMADLGRMQASLRQLVAQVRDAAVGIGHASAEIAQGNHDLSARTESQASALEQTAASMEELTATVRQNADNARQANALAVNASSVAAQGGAVVEQVVQTMRGINEGSHRIADIIGVIDSIAFQTNILALNAAVEAARAGEQGRGFAVVASEVRALAGRSAEAAKEIKDLISASVTRVEQGSTLADQAGATMDEVVSAIRQVTAIVGEISVASSEQSTGVAQVGEAIMQMDQVTQQNAALVEESAAAATSLQTQGQELLHSVAAFRLEDRTRLAQ